MQTEKYIMENLWDAGCDETEISKIPICYRSGDCRNTEKLIEKCRKRQLERLYESQTCIGRLDFLRYRLAKD